MFVWWCDADHDTQSSHPFYMLPVPNGKWTEDMAQPPLEEDLFDHANSNAFHFSDVVGYHVKMVERGKLTDFILIFSFWNSPPKNCSPAFALKKKKKKRCVTCAVHIFFLSTITLMCVIFLVKKEKKRNGGYSDDWPLCRRNALQTSTGLLLRLCVSTRQRQLLSAHTRECSMCCEAESSSAWAS